MQQWSRRSQCIFCQFLTSCRRQQSRLESRQFSTSALLSQDTQTFSVGRRKVTERTVTRHLNRRRDARDTEPSADWRFVFSPAGEEKPRSDSRMRKREILRILRRVKSSFRAGKMNEGSSISQLAALDPEGILWPQFEAKIQGEIDHMSSERRSGLFGTVADADTADFRASVERLIRFAFLDHVLDNGDVLKPRDSQQVDLRYPTEWYPQARQIQRVVHLHVGPTNSGKTYNALKRLGEAGDGFYAGPLRLLAHEVYSRFNSRGIKCDLVTGDDVRQDDSGLVTLYASTVEMVNSNKESEVGIIDEIQMLGDSERGWAWTRALLAAKAKELHLCGEARAVPLVREIIASTGDTLHIHEYERLNPLKVMSKSLKGDLKLLRKGDCVVSFSIVHIHAMKRQIELDTGRRCAIVYGSLPPETRAQQAALFNDPNSDYDFLVASDAIGMGLNLSIKRIIFETTTKWNGSYREQLSIPQIKQIAGRAGRYRTAQDDHKNQSSEGQSSSKLGQEREKPKNIGLVTCLDEKDLPVLHHALANDGPPIKAAGILPPGEAFEELASRLPDDTPFEYILKRMTDLVATNQRFRVCEVGDALQRARAIEKVGGLSIHDKLTICASPASLRPGPGSKSMRAVIVALAKAVAEGKGVTVADVTEIPLEVLDEPMTADRSYLSSLEDLHKTLILFLWLSYRFPRALCDQDMAVRAKQLCEESINTTLLRFSANPQLRLRLAEMRKSSDLLRDQIRTREPVVETEAVMNPDKTVEEIERELMDQSTHQDGEPHLEPKIEVEGELDLGEDELMNQMPEHDRAQSSQDLVDGQKDVEEPGRAVGTG